MGNATFHCGDLKGAAAALGRRVPDPDVIVVDPARAGMAPALVGFLRGTRARRLVYVSCNPPTQARDLRLLCAPVGGGEGGEGGAAGDGGRRRSSYTRRTSVIMGPSRTSEVLLPDDFDEGGFPLPRAGEGEEPLVVPDAVAEGDEEAAPGTPGR